MLGKNMIWAAILTLSDKGSRGRTGGQEWWEVIRNMLTGIDAIITDYEVIPDEKDLITRKTLRICRESRPHCHNGWYGCVDQRRYFPEATRAVIEKE